jgi:hypothetical protein
MRDDFPKAVAETLAKRVGNRCSNPGCRKRTSGPHTQDDKALNVGVAAHITAASPGGPRYGPSLTPEQRRGIGNGIWLCQSCAKLVDNDEARYTKEMLLQWKQDAEQEALREVETTIRFNTSKQSFCIVTHIGTQENISVAHCERHGRPLVPDWLRSNPQRMCSDWLVERLLNGSKLQLYFDPKWCGGTWLVADEEAGDGVVINPDQLADLKPPSPTTTTTTTTPAPQSPVEG